MLLLAAVDQNFALTAKTRRYLRPKRGKDLIQQKVELLFALRIERRARKRVEHGTSEIGRQLGPLREQPSAVRLAFEGQRLVRAQLPPADVTSAGS